MINENFIYFSNQILHPSRTTIYSFLACSITNGVGENTKQSSQMVSKAIFDTRPLFYVFFSRKYSVSFRALFRPEGGWWFIVNKTPKACYSLKFISILYISVATFPSVDGNPSSWDLEFDFPSSTVYFKRGKGRLILHIPSRFAQPSCNTGIYYNSLFCQVQWSTIT